MRNAKRWLAAIVVAALLIALVAVTGCTSTTTTEPTTGTTTEATATAAPKTVKTGVLLVGSDTAFPPFETMNGTTAEGFDVDLAAAIAKEMGLTSEFVSQKFDTLIPQLKAGGKYDIVMSGMTITDERKKEIDFSTAYIDSNQSIAVVKGKGFTKIPVGDTAAIQAAMKGKIIGVQSGTTGEAWAKENLKDAKQVVPFDDTLAAFSALNAGKVDAVVNDLPVSAYLVKTSYKNDELIAEIPTGEQYGIAVSKSTPEMLAAINAGLEKVKASGEYDTIYKKWFGVAPSTSATTTP
jgi:polar amino acid transport system substrate-binding protein